MLGRGNDRIAAAVEHYSVEIDYVSGTDPIYIGRANPGSLPSASAWQICKLTYDGSGNPLSILFANGSRAFDQVWDSRASLSYS
jgi:YD repeat-containing protein